MDPDEAAPEPPAAMTAARVAGDNKKRWQWIAAAAGALIAIGAAFLGIQATKSDSSSSSTNGSNTSAASTPESGPRPNGAPGTQGTIKSIDGSTLTVETSDGDSVEVTTSSDTTVTQTTDGSVSDVAVGDNLLVTGSTSGSQTQAEQIVDMGDQDISNGFGGGGPPGDGSGSGSAQTPPQGAPSGGSGNFTPPVFGSVTAVDNDVITLKTAQGDTATVTTTSSTKVTVRHSAAVSDLTEGDTVFVMGTKDGNVVAATSISEGDGGFGGGGFPGGGSGNFPGAPSSGTGNGSDGSSS